MVNVVGSNVFSMQGLGHATGLRIYCYAALKKCNISNLILPCPAALEQRPKRLLRVVNRHL